MMVRIFACLLEIYVAPCCRSHFETVEETHCISRANGTTRISQGAVIATVDEDVTNASNFLSHFHK